MGNTIVDVCSDNTVQTADDQGSQSVPQAAAGHDRVENQPSRGRAPLALHTCVTHRNNARSESFISAMEPLIE